MIRKKHNNKKNNKKAKNTAIKQRDTFFKNYKQNIITHFINKLSITNPGKKDADYGNHNLTLNYKCPHPMSNSTTKSKTTGIQRYKLWLQGEKTIPNTETLVLPDGSHSFGLVKDKEHASDFLSPPKECTADHLDFLTEMKKLLYLSKNYNGNLTKSFKKDSFNCLRLICSGYCRVYNFC